MVKIPNKFKKKNKNNDDLYAYKGHTTEPAKNITIVDFTSERKTKKHSKKAILKEKEESEESIDKFENLTRERIKDKNIVDYRLNEMDYCSLKNTR